MTDYGENKIKAFVTDVDGCLTDGAIYIGDNSRITRFHAHDGMGVSLLKAAKIPYFAISGRKCNGVKERLEQLNFTGIKLGSKNKLNDLSEMLAPYDIKPCEVAFMGDDLIDIECMEKAAFSYAPQNAVDDIKNVAEHILSREGGEGAVREAVEHMLTHHFLIHPVHIYKDLLKTFTQ